MLFVFYNSKSLTWKGGCLDYTNLPSEVKDCHTSFDRNGNPIAPTLEDDEISTNIHTTISGRLHQLKITTRSTSNGFGWKYEFFPASVKIDEETSSAKTTSSNLCRFGPCCTNMKCVKDHEFPNGKSGKYCVFALQGKCTKGAECRFPHPETDGLIYDENRKKWCQPKKDTDEATDEKA